MKILRKLLYVFFVLLLFFGFVFFGGGRILIAVGKTLQSWELNMKKQFGYFCQQGQESIEKNISGLKNTSTRRRQRVRKNK